MTEASRDRLRGFGVAAAAYLVLSLLWLYGFVDQGFIDEENWFLWVVLALVLALHVVFGFLVREWAALLLPIVVIVLAVPGGYPESDFSEPLPLWIGQIFYSALEIPAIAVGLGLRTLYDGRRRTPSPSR
jgi:hypothetical protein